MAVPALIGSDASFCATLKAYLAGIMPSAALASLWDTLQVCCGQRTSAESPRSQEAACIVHFTGILL